jgi:hypothetical protein
MPRFECSLIFLELLILQEKSAEWILIVGVVEINVGFFFSGLDLLSFEFDLTSAFLVLLEEEFVLILKEFDLFLDAKVSVLFECVSDVFFSLVKNNFLF